MASINWSRRAIRDLDEICEYVSRNSEHYSRLLARQVVFVVESIPDQPRLGAMVPEYNRDEIRERLLHNYRIIYRIVDSDIEIVSITHGARLLPLNPPN